MAVATAGFSIVALLAIAVTICATFVMMVVGVRSPREPAVQFWMPAAMLATVSTITLVVRPPQQDPLSAIGGSTGFVITYLLLWLGFARFLGRRPPWLMCGAIALLHLGAMAWFVLVAPQPLLRTGFTSLAIALLAAGTCITLLRQMRDDLLPSQAFVALLFGALAVGCLTRGLLGLFGTMQGTGFADSPVGDGVYLIPAVQLLLVAISIGLMLRRRPFSAPTSAATPRRPDPASPSAAGGPPPR